MWVPTEISTVIHGKNIAFLGKQIRRQLPGMAHMTLPDGNIPHSNINGLDIETMRHENKNRLGNN